MIETDQYIKDPIGKKIVFGKPDGLRLAVICDWGSPCGISTYTKYLIDSMRSKVDALQIFSEVNDKHAEDGVIYNWKRGQSMRGAIQEVLDWKPSIVMIQHEYGIFPKTTYVMQMFEMLRDTPYAVTMHSVYEHLDKTVASSVMNNIIVHTQEGRECLKRLGNTGRVFVIPHGCVQMPDTAELWNTWNVEYPIVQFGFGFEYKGVDVALEAIKLLKEKHGNKYDNIFYTYFCSDSPHVRNVISANVAKLREQVAAMGLENNVSIIQGFQTDKAINNILRTSRMALFPYKTDPNNTVYGASGAVRIAMANGVPVIASNSHMFDDLDGVLPRPANAAELATAIDHIFSDGKARQRLLEGSARYLTDHSWDRVADMYLDAFRSIQEKSSENVIYL